MSARVLAQQWITLGGYASGPTPAHVQQRRHSGEGLLLLWGSALDLRELEAWDPVVRLRHDVRQH